MKSYSDVCVVIPTYNEEMTIGELVERSLSFGVGEVLVVDDGTDNTANIARGCGARVTPGGYRRGLGPSIVLGLNYARKEGFKYAVVMDAGGTHDPGKIPELVDVARSGYDLVIASRFLHSHKTYGHRTLISLMATWCVRKSLGFRVSDATTGFRCYRLSKVENILKQCTAKGFSIQVELLGRMVLDGSSFYEIEVDYTLSESTFSWCMIVEGLWVLFRVILYRMGFRFDSDYVKEVER